MNDADVNGMKIMTIIYSKELDGPMRVLWRRQCIPVFWPREFHGLYSPWGHKELDMTEKAMAPHSSTLAWRIPWMEEPGRLQSMGSRRVGHD